MNLYKFNPYPLNWTHLYACAQPLTAVQKRAAFDMLTNILTAEADHNTQTSDIPVVKILRDAIQFSHDHANPPVPRRQFWENLFVADLILREDPKRNVRKNQVPADPYKYLDVQACLKYIYQGGGRVTSKPGDSQFAYAQDQEAFFKTFAIDHRYTDVDGNRFKHYLEAGGYEDTLSILIQLRNKKSHTNADFVDQMTMAPIPSDPSEDTTAQSIPYYLNQLAVLLQPLCQTPWSGQDDAKWLYDNLWPKLHEQIGEVRYSIEKLMDEIGLPSDQQDKIELLLIEAGATVDQGLVSFCGDIVGFAYALFFAWTTAVPYSWEQGVNLLRNMLEQIRVTPAQQPESPDAERQIDWDNLEFAELLANKGRLEPKRHYRLGLCYLQGKGTDPDSYQAYLAFKQAAKQGYAPAQVELGRWYEARNSEPTDLQEAFHWYQAAAEQKDPEGLYHLGRCYKEKIGVGYDQMHAEENLYAAAQAGHQEAQFALGEFYYYDRGCRKEAFDIFTEMAEEGYAPAMRELAECYTYNFTATDGLGNRIGWDADERKALKLFRKAAAAGDVKAWLKLGQYYMKKYRPEYDKALAAFVKAAEQGDAEAQFQAAEIYYKGPDTFRNPKEAFKWYEKAANQNHKMAHVMLAECYADGVGVKENMGLASDYYCYDGSDLGKSIHALYERKERLQDPDAWDEDELDMEDAFKSLRKELKAYDRFLTAGYTGWSKEELKQILENNKAPGRAVAMYELAECYEHGWGTKQDHAQAFDLYASAARLDLRKAMHALGRCYETGIGTDVDLQAAFAQYEKSAKQGYLASMRAMWRCCEEGIGTASDSLAAWRWLEAACDAGDTPAMRMLAQRYLDGTALSPTGEPMGPNQEKAIAYLEQAIKAGDTAAAAEFYRVTGEAYWSWKYRRDSLQQQHTSLENMLASRKQPEWLQEQEIDDLQAEER